MNADIFRYTYIYMNILQKNKLFINKFNNTLVKLTIITLYISDYSSQELCFPRGGDCCSLKQLQGLILKVRKKNSQTSCMALYVTFKLRNFQLTIAKKMAACQFYHDPLQKADFICSKTVIFYRIKISENKVIHQNVW